MLLSIPQLAGVWLAAGGPRSRMVEFVSISLAESGGESSAVSPVGAIGCWQIMPFNAAPNGVTVAELYNPQANADVAVRMSGHGVNCAAWDTCYRNILVSGRYSFLGFPEGGSAAYGHLFTVANILHQTPPAPAPGAGIGPTHVASKTAALEAEWTKVGFVLGKWSDGYERDLTALTMSANKLATTLIVPGDRTVKVVIPHGTA